MVNDTVADMLTRIRNALLVKHSIVQVPSTQLINNIVQVVKEEGFIEDFEEVKNGFTPCLLIGLKYKGKKKSPIIKSLKRVSKPGLRVYSNYNELPKVLGGLGIAIISTSQGIMTDKKARYYKIGGEVLCYIW